MSDINQWAAEYKAQRTRELNRRFLELNPELAQLSDKQLYAALVAFGQPFTWPIREAQ